MSVVAMIGFAAGILGPLAMAAACVFELIGRRMAKNPRCDRTRLERFRTWADIGLVAAWLLLAAAYLVFRYAPDAEVLSAAFEAMMTWMLGALLVLDIAYLYLRRSRPRDPNAKKRFWEL